MCLKLHHHKLTLTCVEDFDVIQSQSCFSLHIVTASSTKNHQVVLENTECVAESPLREVNAFLSLVFVQKAFE